MSWQYSAPMSRPGTSSGMLGGGRGGGYQISMSSGRPGTASFPNLPGYRRPGIEGDIRREQFEKKKAQSLHFVNGIPMVTTALSFSRPQTAGGIDNLASLNQTQMPKDANQFSDLSGRYSLAKQRKDRENLAKISSNMVVSKIGRRTVPAIDLAMKSSNSQVNDNDSISTWGGNFNDDVSSVAGSVYPNPDNKAPLPPVLLFYGYYFEDIIESNMESKRIHRCEIFYYTEDGSIEIIECKQANSGMPQGSVLRRMKATKRGGGYISINDLKMGGSVVEIYARGYTIIGCNDSTLRFVRANMNWTEDEMKQGDWPEDEFIKKNREKMMRETGAVGVNRNRKMHEMKEYMEALLGKPTAMSDLGSFLESGNKTLCFDIVWDDTERLYGDVRLFKLCYFLSDDTLEIVPVHTRNDGRDQFPKLLKRSKVPKDIRNPEGPKYTWRDFRIGGIINVYQRAMTIAKADKFTRDFYASKGMHIGNNIELVRGPDVKYERQIPPYNGFGSEEDSLRSCTGSIRPGVPKKHFHYDKRGHVTRFNAKLLTNKLDDKVRRFVVQYYLEDDTVAVREPPLRNSGIVGGQFLRRQPMKHSDGTKVLSSDLYVGAILNLNCHKFLIMDADEGTYRLMESDPQNFPLSDWEALHKLLREYRHYIKAYFIKESSNGNDRPIDFQGLKACMNAVGLDRLKKQQLITIWRKIDRRGKGKVSWMKLVKVAENKPIHVTIQSHRDNLMQEYQD